MDAASRSLYRQRYQVGWGLGVVVPQSVDILFGFRIFALVGLDSSEERGRQ